MQHLLVSLLSYGLIVWGILWTLLEVWMFRKRIKLRHRITGEMMPAAPFFELLFSLVRSSFGYTSDPIEKSLANRKKYGDMYLAWRGWYPIVIVHNFEDVKTLLAERGDFYKPDLASSNPILIRMFGKSLVSVSGETWKRQRKTMDPAFKYKKLKTLVPLFTQSADKLLHNWDKVCNKGPIKVEDGLTAMTLDVIGLAGFSYPFGALDQAEDGSSTADSALENYEFIQSGMFSPIYFFLPALVKVPTPYNRKMNGAFAKMDEIFYSIIQKHREKTQQGNDTDNHQEDLDLLDHILSLDDHGSLSNAEIRDNLFLFFLAGHDTSSSTLTSALYFLAVHPDIQERAFEEVKSVVGDNALTYNDLQKLELVGNIIKETVRLRPPVGGTSARKCAREGVVLGDYHIPAGQLLSPSIFGVNYDPKLWHNPDVFDPDRYKDKSTPESAITTFSLGPHVCIGKKFALMEMTIALTMMIRRFRFELVPGYKWTYRTFSLTLKPIDGLPLTLKRR